MSYMGQRFNVIEVTGLGLNLNLYEIRCYIDYGLRY